MRQEYSYGMIENQVVIGKEQTKEIYKNEHLLDIELFSKSNPRIYMRIDIVYITIKNNSSGL